MLRTRLTLLVLFAGLPLTGCSHESRPPTPAPELTERLVGEQTLAVRESDSDVDTSIDVLIGDRLAINAAGEIWAGVADTGENGPNGWNNVDPDPKFPLPGSHPYSLIGKIGTTYFFIGNGDQVNHSIANGRLFLRINDDMPGNGTGAFTVDVKLYRRQ